MESSAIATAFENADPLSRPENETATYHHSQINHLMNGQLASVIDLQTQIKQAYWNVKGPRYFSLHQLFEQIYISTEFYADTIAERIVQLGGVARGTVRVAAGKSQLVEYPLMISEGPDHLKALASALGRLGGQIHHSIEQAKKLQDADSADIFTDIAEGIDKWLRFVNAHSQSAR